MAGSAFKDPDAVADVKRNFTPILIDGDDPENSGVMSRFGIEGFPTLVFTDAAGNVRDMIVGPDVQRFKAAAARPAK